MATIEPRPPFDAAAGGADRLRGRLLERGLLATLCALGAWLRLDQLPQQVPFHDEWHALLAVARWDAARIFSSFGHADHSIPVALYLEALSRLDRLAPLALWGPFALAGLVTLVLLPVAAARHIGREAAWLLAPLLALSPLLVYYSRTARPYVYTAPLALGVALAVAAWWRRPGARAALGVALLAAIVGWSMLAHIPFVAGAVATAVLLRPASARRWRDGGAARATLALLAGGLTAALLAAPLIGDLRNLDRKVGSAPVEAENLMAGFRLFPGSGSWPFLAVLLALGIDGAVHLYRRERTLALVLAGASSVQLTALLVTRPDSFGAPLVAARYLMPIGLVVMLCAALSAARHLDGRISRWVAPVALLLLAVVFWAPAAPLLGARPDNFRSTALHRLFHFEPARMLDDAAALPPAYGPILAARDEFAILEAPYNGYLHVPYGEYQRLHRRIVHLGVETGFCSAGDTREIPAAGQGGFALDRFVGLGELDRMRELGIRFIVLHRDPETEIPRLEPTWKRVERFDFEGCLAELEAELGRPAVARDGIALFDLGTVAVVPADGRSGRRAAAAQTSDSR